MEIEEESRLKDLVEFGLTPLQARVYVALLRGGRATSGELAKAMGINRVDAYRALKALEKRGIVQCIVGSVKRYEAIDPATALKIMIEEAEDKLRTIKQKAIVLRSWLESQRYSYVPLQLEPEPSSTFKIIYGRTVFQRMVNALNNAKKEILRVSSPSGLKVNYVLGIFDVEQRKAEEGVVIKTIIDIQEEILEEVSVYAKFADVRHLPKSGTSLRYVIVDDEHAFIFTNLPTPKPKEHACLYTQNEVIISALKKNFDELWILAQPWKDRAVQMGLLA